MREVPACVGEYLRSWWEPCDLEEVRETRGVLRLDTVGERSMGEEEEKGSAGGREEGRSREGTEGRGRCRSSSAC